jgi:magnesium chelatase subunit D
VRIAVEDRRRLALAALQLGVEGNRADIFALRAARANAALAGRLCVEEEDIAAAIQLVLWPRALVTPAPGAEQEARTQQASERPSPSESSSQAGASEISNFKSEISNRPQLIIQALDTPLPPGLLAPPHRFQRRSVTGSRGETLNRVRGRYVKSIPGRPGDGRVAIDVTLRAAAPLQTLRPHRCAKRRISIEPSDLRFKRFKQKAGMLFIFVVDASGSMALNRMHQAKGALLRLLKEAYLHRDQIALVSFRGRQAEVLLPPSQSVERARRTLESLPVGGGTPLSAGLLAALDLAKRARQVGIQQTMLVLLTDGRANVGVNAEAADPTMRRQAIQQELARVGAALQRAGVASLVIDTQARFTSRDEGRALADLLGGRYIYLPRASAADVYETIASVATDLRGEH